MKIYKCSKCKENKLEKMLVEIAKCELVCANCHADRTYLRLGYSQ